MTKNSGKFGYIEIIFDSRLMSRTKIPKGNLKNPYHYDVLEASKDFEPVFFL
jgi:hypothetical protein